MLPDSRYQMESNNTRYQTSQGHTSPSTHYGTPPYYYNHSSVPRSQQQHTNPPFIPTPSELTQISRNPHGTPQTPGHSPELTANDYVIPREPSQQQTRLPPAVRPRTGSGGSPTTERFPCEKCGKTFSRSHDRKRHHETQHLSTPVVHRCRYCEKEFSRRVALMTLSDSDY
jgi:hypothetical protein